MAWATNFFGAPKAPTKVKVDEADNKETFKLVQTRVRDLDLKLNQVDAEINKLRKDAFLRKQKNDMNGCRLVAKQIVSKQSKRNKIQVQLNNAHFLKEKIEETLDLVDTAKFEERIFATIQSNQARLNSDKISELRDNMEDAFRDLDDVSNTLNTEFESGIHETEVDEVLASLGEEEMNTVGYNQGIVQPNQQQYIPQQQIPTIPDSYVTDMPSVPANRVRPTASTTATTVQPTSSRVAVPMGADGGGDDMLAMLSQLNSN